MIKNNQSAYVSKIKHRVIIAGDGIIKSNGRENKLQILETIDGEILISIATYESADGSYVTGGIVRIKTRGKKYPLLVPLKEIICKALELKKNIPKSGVEGS